MSAERWKSSTPSDTVSVVCVRMRAGDAGDGGGDGVDLADMRAARPRRSRACAPAFSRMPRSDRPNGELISAAAHQEQQEQHDQRVPVGGVAVEVELEHAEQRPHVHALQAVGAAGQPARAVGGLQQQQAEAERDHDQREMPEARDDEAHQVAEQPGRDAPRSAGRSAARPSPTWRSGRRCRRRSRRTRRGRATRCRHSRGSDRARAQTAR